MALNTSAVQVGSAAIAADIDHMTTHTAQPDATGSNRTTAAAQVVAPTSTGGVITVPSTNFTGGAASGPCTHVGLWHGDPASGGTFRGWEAVTSGDTTFNAAGAITISSVTITGSAT